MVGAVAVPPSPEHWSLHRGPDGYQLLVQVRPTDVYDTILLHKIGMNVTELMTSLVIHDGRVFASPMVIEVAWLRSEWRHEDDGSLTVTKVSVDAGAQADDVMLVVTASLIPAGGTS